MGGLRTDGRLEDREGLIYFEPDPERERLTLTLDTGVPYAEVRAFLQAEALRRPDASLCVSETYTSSDGRPDESLYLFVRAYGGVVWLHHGPPDTVRVAIHLSYDRRRRTPDVDRLLAFCHGRMRQRGPWWRRGWGR